MRDSGGGVSERLAELMTEVRAERGQGRSVSAGSPGPATASGSGTSRARGSLGRGRAVRIARWVGIAAAALVLPFFVLLRTATWLYGAGVLGTWTALAAGAALTFVVLAAYALLAARWARKRFGGGGPSRAVRSAADGGAVAAEVARRARTKRLMQGVAIVVVAYCGYGLVFLSGANARSDAVRAEYRSLHPHLRMAVATLVLVDSDLLVTDAARDLEDYAAMGLPPNEASLHLEQRDGYAHALDLRTAGRPAVVNVLTRAWFRAAGFRTLRHVGTADHLHVSLPLPGDS